MNKLVSVIIPAYNGSKLITDAIDSVLTQDYDPIEIIVINDSSTDNTVEVVSNYGEKVTLINHSHQQGASAARNTGIHIAQGYYIAPLDHDDIYTPDAIRLRVEALENNPEIKIVFGHEKYFYDDHIDETLKQNLEKRYGNKTIPGELIGTLLMRRDDMLAVGHFITDIDHHDFLVWYGKAKDMGYKSMMLDKVITHRRIHNNNTSLTNKHVLLNSLKMLLDRRRQASQNQSESS